MIAYGDIRDVHLEISTLCNASCPWCPRNFWGYPHNGGYPEVNLSLAQSQQIFTTAFLRQLTSLRINGNFGDIVMNPQGADIVEYFRHGNDQLRITINSNGGARDKEFWTQLARAGAVVNFALDGLEDTHALYRQNTSWKTVIKNAGIFIDAGGHAEWQMIKFQHNQHQIEQARTMSQALGFREFVLIESVRDTAPVFDRHGNLSHIIGDYQGETEFKVLFHKKQHDEVLLEDILPGRLPRQRVTCQTQQMKSIYIAANGDVSPCCFTGFYPRSYGRGQYHEAANSQLVPLISKNNALEYPLQECIEWFGGIKNSWRVKSYQQGRLVICDDNCGSD